jgi:hypothetical protein
VILVQSYRGFVGRFKVLLKFVAWEKPLIGTHDPIEQWGLADVNAEGRLEDDE